MGSSPWGIPLPVGNGGPRSNCLHWSRRRQAWATSNTSTDTKRVERRTLGSSTGRRLRSLLVLMIRLHMRLPSADHIHVPVTNPAPCLIIRTRDSLRNLTASSAQEGSITISNSTAVPSRNRELPPWIAEGCSRQLLETRSRMRIAVDPSSRRRRGCNGDTTEGG
jgi:hypothetical protein